MPYQLIWKEDSLVQKYVGEISPDEIMQANNAIYGDPRYDALRVKIADFSDANGDEITQESIQTVASLDKASSVWNRHLKVAVLAPTVLSPAEMRHYALQYKEELSTTDWEIDFFSTRQELDNWLAHK